eukprot:6204022-Pleurochrysis_carterae.AAC.1
MRLASSKDTRGTCSRRLHNRPPVVQARGYGARRGIAVQRGAARQTPGATMATVRAGVGGWTREGR